MTAAQRRHAAIVLAGFGLAVILLLPLMIVGVPAYLHDWSWPPDAAGARTHLLQGWSAWLDDGIGYPNPYPTALPHYLVLGWMTAIVPSRALLALLLVASFTIAFVSAVAFARRTFGLRAGAIACGVLYAAAPLALTELLSGHLSYIQAYAVFPVFALALREAHAGRRWIGLGALAVAVTAPQVQFLAFDALYMAIALATRAARPAAARNISLLALPMIVPVLLGPTLNAHGGAGIFVHQHALIDWEREQSAPPLDALMGLGYFTRYVSRLALPYTTYALLLVTLCAAFGAALRARVSADARALVICGACGWLLVIGLNGPLAPLAIWAFENVTPMSVFREIFNVMVLFWFPVCVLAGVGLERLPRRLAVALCVVVAAVLATPWATYGRYFVPAPDPAALRAVASIAADAQAQGVPAGRVVWWPTLQPIGPRGRAQGGSDPLGQTPLAATRPLYEYQPNGAYGTAVALATLGRWDEAATILRWLGVRYIVTRRGIVSYANGTPQDTPAPSGRAVRRLGAADGFDVYGLAGARALITVEPDVAPTEVQTTPFEASRRQAVPEPGVLVEAFPYLWRAPATADCGDSAVLGDAATIAAQGGRWVLAAPLTGDRCAWLTASALRAAGSVLYVAAGSANAPTPRGNLPAMPLAEPSSLIATEGRWRARLTSPQAGLLVVRTSFDARWRADIDGRDAGAARRWNGFPAWPIGRGPHAVDLRYSGEAPIRAALVVALLGIVLAATLAAWPERRGAQPM